MTFIRISKLICLTAFVVITYTLPATAQDYGHGNGALQVFDAEGQTNTPQWVLIWIVLMLGTFAAGLIFVRNHVPARWIVGGLILGFVAMGILTGPVGLLPLSGFIALMHILFWTPGLILLIRERAFLKDRSLYSLWAGLMTAVILFSFIFDIRDASIYLDHSLGIGILS